MPRIYRAVALMFMLAPAAFEQIPKGDAFFGYSYSRSTLAVPVFPPDRGGILGGGKVNLNGWNAAFASQVFVRGFVPAQFFDHFFDSEGRIERRERLGGLLNYYYRAA